MSLVPDRLTSDDTLYLQIYVERARVFLVLVSDVLRR